MTTPEPRSTQQLAEDRTALAATRTLLAADRTLMAWGRTSVSMLGFSFTLYKVLDEFQRAGRALPRDETPRNVGLFLAALGTAAMVMGTLEYLQTLRALRQFQPVRFMRSSLLMALVMSAAGLLLFFGIITGLF